ncbi:TAXI family TRAP transporter solute-binding subunit [Roseibium sp. SCPC15]|uniref:TAXI family TRAP transporter solute-binding subunit n=1 Tax=Roseibium sp. SCP15 TaxID=3141376 RepID=UPI003335B3AB
MTSSLRFSWFSRWNYLSFRRLIIALFLIAVNALAFPLPSSAQGKQELIGVISGGITGTYARFAAQMASVIDSEAIRVLPMLGKGSQQNIRDLMQINGIDIAIVQSDVLDFYKNTQEIPNIQDSIRYIGKLYNEEVHIVTRAGVETIKELEGALVGVGPAGSGTEMTALTLFEALGISVVPVNASNQEALDQVKEGALTATVFVAGKPTPLIEAISAEDGLILLPIELGKSVQGAYFSTRFTHDDYPDLVDEAQSLDTVAVGAVLAVFNWRQGTPRYQAVSEFCADLLSALEILKTGGAYHPKWQEVDLTVNVPGWQRFGGMEELLAN